MSLENKGLTEACEHYLNKILQVPNELKDLRVFISKSSNVDLSISDTQISFFETMLKTKQPESILEIGTFYGYSTICFALFSDKNTAITTIDRDKKTLEKAREQWLKFPKDIFDKINTITDEATPALEHLLSKNKTYDLIFIDADKNNYQNYFNLSLKLLEKNGIIIIDNIFQEGNIFLSKEEIEKQFGENDKRRCKRTLLMKDLVENICQDKNLITSISPLGDGMLIIQKV